MEGVSEERSKEKFIRKNSGKACKSRKHDKADNRKHRKKWFKKKHQRQQEQKSPVQQQERLAVEESCQVLEEKAKERARKELEHVSRGKRLVELSKQRKRKNDAKK